METKRFKMIDESFVCENCKKEVKPLGYTARDHCPFCLYSKHLDINRRQKVRLSWFIKTNRNRKR